VLDLIDQQLLTPYQVNKKTIQVPTDWKVDRPLLKQLVSFRVAQL
jgi:uncharacterized protein YdhG (YjbR/CyaY superfamily)